MNSSIFTFDSITRALRIGAFSGLAVTLYAVFTDSHWLLEGKYFIKATQKSLQERGTLAYY